MPTERVSQGAAPEFINTYRFLANFVVLFCNHHASIIGQYWFDSILSIVYVFLDEFCRQQLHLVPTLATSTTCTSRRSAMQQRVELLVYSSGASFVHAGVIFVIGREVQRQRAAILPGALVLVHTQNVVGDVAVFLGVQIIQDDEQQIETRQERVRQIDVFLRADVAIVLAIDRIRCRNNRASRIQRGLDAGLGNGDCLLFHYFVDRNTVQVTHFVEFINAHHAPVSQHHCTSLKTPITRFRVGSDSSCQTDT